MPANHDFDYDAVDTPQTRPEPVGYRYMDTLEDRIKWMEGYVSVNNYDGEYKSQAVYIQYEAQAACIQYMREIGHPGPYGPGMFGECGVGPARPAGPQGVSGRIGATGPCDITTLHDNYRMIVENGIIVSCEPIPSLADNIDGWAAGRRDQQDKAEDMANQYVQYARYFQYLGTDYDRGWMIIENGVVTRFELRERIIEEIIENGTVAGGELVEKPVTESQTCPDTQPVVWFADRKPNLLLCNQPENKSEKLLDIHT